MRAHCSQNECQRTLKQVMASVAGCSAPAGGGTVRARRDCGRLAASGGGREKRLNGVARPLQKRWFARLSVGLLVAAMAAGSVPVHGQSADTVLVSNDGVETGTQTTAEYEIGFSNKDRSQSFTTGSAEDGYTLSSIWFYITRNQSSFGSKYVVRLHQGDTPSTKVFDLVLATTNPDADGQWHKFVPASGTTEEQKKLAANTAYSVYLKLKSGSGSNRRVDFRNTDSSAQIGQPGWSIADKSHKKLTSGTWSGSSRAFVLRVRGTLTSGTPVVTLNVTPAEIGEGGTASVTATAEPAPEEAFTLQVLATPVAPARSSHYTLSENTTLSFAAGATQSTGEVTITVADNEVNQGDRTVSVTASSTAEVIQPPAVTLTITEDDTSTAFGPPSSFTANPTHESVVLEWQPPLAHPPHMLFQYRMKAGAGEFGDWTNIPLSRSGLANHEAYIVETLAQNTSYEFKLRGKEGADNISDELAASAQTFSPFLGEFTELPGFHDKTTTGAADRLETILTFNAELYVAAALRGGGPRRPAQAQNARFTDAWIISAEEGKYALEVQPSGGATEATLTLSTPEGPLVRCTRQEAEGYWKICSSDLRPLARDIVGAIRGQRAVRLRLDPSSIPENGGVATVTARLHKFHPSSVHEHSDVPFHIEVSVSPQGPAVERDYALSSNTRLHFAAGQRNSTGTVTITSIDDQTMTGARTLRVSAVASASHVSLHGSVDLTLEEDEEGGLVPPTGITFTPALTALKLTWEDAVNSGTPSYQYMIKEGNGEWSIPADIPDSGPGGHNHRSWTVPNLQPDTTYRFKLRAYDESNLVVISDFFQTPEVSTLSPYTVAFVDPPSHFHGNGILQLHVRFDRDLKTALMMRPENANVAVQGGTFKDGTRVRARHNADWFLNVTPDEDAAEIVVTLDNGDPPYWLCGESEDTQFCSSERHPLTEGATVTLRRLVAPAAPTNLAATPGENFIALAWETPDDSAPAAARQHRYQAGTAEFSEWTDMADSADGGANAASFTLDGLSPDQAHTIQVRAVNAAGTSGEVQVTASTNSSSKNATGAPTISGTARVSETLTAGKGTIADPDGLDRADGGEADYAYGHQWIRVDSDGVSNPAAIGGATSSSYTLVADDIGRKIKVRVGFQDDAGNEEARTSSATEAVQSLGALELNLDVITGDDTVNIAEKAAGFTISGDTGSVGGVSVTVRVADTIRYRKFTATSSDADPATWSVSVPADALYITGTSVDVELKASKSDYTAPAAVRRTLTVDLVAPAAPSYAAPSSLKVGETITAMSPSGGSGIDAYRDTGLPSGLSIDANTGVISGAPDTASADTAAATVTVSDVAGNTATVEIAFPAVAKGDQALSGFQYSASSVTFGSTAPTATAPSGVQTTLSYAATPSTVCTVDAATGALTLVGAGECVITATAAGSDDYNGGATATFTVTVRTAGALELRLNSIAGDNRVNIAEKAAGFTVAGDTGSKGGAAVTVTVGDAELTATSANANPATWSVSVPANAGYITGTSVDVAVNAFKSGYTDPDTIERALTIDLTAPTPPTYTAPASLKVGETITAMSPSGGSGIDAYSDTGLPSGLSIDAGTGAISGTPDTADEDTAAARVTVTDSAGNTARVEITFPAVAKGDQALSGFQYSVSMVTLGSTAPTLTAPSGVRTTLSYAATPSTVCSVDATTGALTLAAVGSCLITATVASSAEYNEAAATFTVTVRTVGALVLHVNAIATDNRVNIAEKAAGFTIAGDTGSEGGAAVTVTVGTTELTATSAHTDPATWSVSVPANAGYITGTSVDVAVNASKSGYTDPDAIERALTIDLTAPTPPTYTAPASLKVGETIAAMSPSGGSGIDAYRDTGLPSGLSIDANTGVISGTPDTADEDTAAVRVTVTDSAGNTARVDITFPAVAKGDQALSGFQYSVSMVTLGSTAPTLTAPSGVRTTLSYAATPSTVCSVDATTGALTLAAVGSCLITATVASSAEYNEAAATFTVTVRTVGALVLHVNAIATDNRVNIAEKAAGFTIAGDTGSEGGAAVTVTVGTTELTATSAHTDPATWSVSVPANAGYITGTSVDVAVNASKSGYTDPDAIERALTIDLTAPTPPTYTAPASLKVEETIAAMSPSGGSGIDAYRDTGLPSGLSIDANTGVISGAPDTASAGTAAVRVTVTDAAGNPARVDITFPAVAKGDQALSGFQYSVSVVTLGSTAPTLTAPSGVRMTLSYAATPSTVCSVDATTGALTLAAVGSCLITATAASSADYNEAAATFTVTVRTVGALVLHVNAIATDNRVNIAEQAAGFTIAGDTGSEGGATVTVTVGTTELTATSAHTDPATWSVSVPANAGYITGTSVDVAVNASKSGYTAPDAIERALTIDLTAPTPPTYTAPASLKVGETIAAMSPSGGSGIDAYRDTGLPSGLSIDANTGVISGTPDTADEDTAAARVTVTDSAGNTARVDITFPAVAKGDQTLAGFQYSVSSVAFGGTAPTVTAPSGVVTSVSYAAMPSTVCSVDAATGALTLAAVGSCEITATAASSADYNEAAATFTVTVRTVGALVLHVNAIATDNRVNIAEKAAGFTIAGDTGSEGGATVTVTVGTTELTATSAHTDPAAWSVDVPANAGYITGTSVDVAVNASKSGYTDPDTIERALTIDLTAPTPPTYTAPASLKVGETITAMSPSGGSGIDAYRDTGLPSGLSIDANTGVISGAPDTADEDTAAARVTVTDTAGNPARVDITFPAVAKGDQALSGFQYSVFSVAFGGTAPTVTAPSGAVTSVTYAATPSTVCSVDAVTGKLTLAAVGSCEITATAASSADYNEAAATFTVTVRTVGALVLHVNAIATDNRVNIAEKAAGFTIAGDTGSEGGATVTVTVGTTELTATSAHTDPAAWSVDVPANAGYITGTSVDVAVNASKSGYTDPDTIERALTIDLTAPTPPTYTAPASLKVGETITAMSPSGGSGIDAYRDTGLPSGLSIDANTGVISGAPDTADEDTAAARVTVTDAAGNPARVDITFPAVAKGDQTLAGFQYSVSSVAFGGTAPTVTAPTGAVNAVTYSATAATVCGINSSTGALTLVGVGSCVVTATAASSDKYNGATATFTVTVRAVGELVLNVNAIATDNRVNIAEQAAGFTIAGDTGSEAGASVTVMVGATELTATSGSGDPATWSVSVPANAGYITGTSVDVVVNASKLGYTLPGAVERTLTVDLTAPTAPSYTAPGSLQVGETITAMNPTGGSGIDAYRDTGLPSGLSIDAGTGAISGTPDTADEDTAAARVTVTDTAGNTARVDITFPAVAKGDQALSGFQYGVSSVAFGGTAPTVTAPSGAVTSVTYAATPSTVCNVDAVTGKLTLAAVGSCEITATAASSADYNEAAATFTVTVRTVGALVLHVNAIATDNRVNIAEKAAGFTIAGDTGSEGGATVTVTVGTTELTATSAHTDPAAWSVDVPANAGYITGTSVDVAVNAFKSGYTAPDAIERALTIDLTAPTPPTYTAPTSLKVGETITAMSPSGGADIDAYSAAGLPPGLSIDSSTGAISGTPDTASADTAAARVTVTDAAGNTARVDITFPAVAKGDQTLSGFEYSVSSVAFGDGAPTVTAPIGAVNAVTYSATPASVCTVDSATGALALMDAGRCVVTATAASSDGYNEATATFTLPPVTGS